MRCRVPGHLQKDRPVHPSHPGPAHEEEVSLEVAQASTNMLQSNTTDSHVISLSTTHSGLVAELQLLLNGLTCQLTVRQEL